MSDGCPRLGNIIPAVHGRYQLIGKDTKLRVSGSGKPWPSTFSFLVPTTFYSFFQFADTGCSLVGDFSTSKYPLEVAENINCSDCGLRQSRLSSLQWTTGERPRYLCRRTDAPLSRIFVISLPSTPFSGTPGVPVATWSRWGASSASNAGSPNSGTATEMPPSDGGRCLRISTARRRPSTTLRRSNVKSGQWCPRLRDAKDNGVGAGHRHRRK